MKQHQALSCLSLKLKSNAIVVVESSWFLKLWKYSTQAKPRATIQKSLKLCRPLSGNKHATESCAEKSSNCTEKPLNCTGKHLPFHQHVPKNDQIVLTNHQVVPRSHQIVQKHQIIPRNHQIAPKKTSNCTEKPSSQIVARNDQIVPTKRIKLYGHFVQLRLQILKLVSFFFLQNHLLDYNKKVLFSRLKKNDFQC